MTHVPQLLPVQTKAGPIPIGTPKQSIEESLKEDGESFVELLEGPKLPTSALVAPLPADADIELPGIAKINSEEVGIDDENAESQFSIVDLDQIESNLPPPPLAPVPPTADVKVSPWVTAGQIALNATVTNHIERAPPPILATDAHGQQPIKTANTPLQTINTNQHPVNEDSMKTPVTATPAAAQNNPVRIGESPEKESREAAASIQQLGQKTISKSTEIARETTAIAQPSKSNLGLESEINQSAPKLNLQNTEKDVVMPLPKGRENRFDNIRQTGTIRETSFVSDTISSSPKVPVAPHFSPPSIDPLVHDRIELSAAFEASSKNIQTVQPATPSVQQAQTEARQISQQLAVHFSKQHDGTTVVRLNPDELGHVRMTLRSIEGAMTMTVTAERPETADLMRRNINELAQEFQSMGFENLSFDFDDDQSQPPDNAESSQAQAGSDLIDTETPKTQPPPQTTVSNGRLDIRL